MTNRSLSVQALLFTKLLTFSMQVLWEVPQSSYTLWAMLASRWW